MIAVTLTGLQLAFWAWFLVLVGIVVGYLLAHFAHLAATQCDDDSIESLIAHHRAAASGLLEAPQPGEETTQP